MTITAVMAFSPPETSGSAQVRLSDPCSAASALQRQLLTSGPAFGTLRPWERTLSDSDSGPTPRRGPKRFPISSTNSKRVDMANSPNAKIPSPSAPTWQNWSGNLVHKPASDGGKYYFAPTNLTELKSVLTEVSKVRGAMIPASG